MLQNLPNRSMMKNYKDNSDQNNKNNQDYCLLPSVPDNKNEIDNLLHEYNYVSNRKIYIENRLNALGINKPNIIN